MNVAEKELRKNGGNDMFLHRSELYNRSFKQMQAGHYPKNKVDETKANQQQKYGGTNLKAASLGI